MGVCRGGEGMGNGVGCGGVCVGCVVVVKVWVLVCGAVWEVVGSNPWSS